MTFQKVSVEILTWYFREGMLLLFLCRVVQSGSESGKDDFIYQIVLESTDSNTDAESSESIRSIQAESTG